MTSHGTEGGTPWLTALAAVAEDMLCVLGSDGCIKYINPAGERILGHSGSELMKRSILDLIHPDDHDIARAALQQPRDRVARQIEARCVCRDGSYKPLAWTAHPVNGRVFAIGRQVQVRPTPQVSGTPPEVPTPQPTGASVPPAGDAQRTISPAARAPSPPAAELSGVVSNLRAIAGELARVADLIASQPAPSRDGARPPQAQADTLLACHASLTALAATVAQSVGTALGSGEVPAPHPASPAAPSSDSAQPAHDRAHVLVIDDDPAVARSLVRVLSRRYNVRVARNGAQALALIEDGQTFDAILCDIVMPVMDGVAFYRALSTTRPALTARVAFVTGGALTDDAAEFLHDAPNLRADKPCPPARLLALVEQLLAIPPTRDAPDPG